MRSPWAIAWQSDRVRHIRSGLRQAPGVRRVNRMIAGAAPTLAAVASRYTGSIAAGEALFSTAEAKLLNRYGGLRCDRDLLLFDPVHCYGLPGYLQIIELFEAHGWRRTAFWPHGGHLFCLHVAAAL